MNKQLIGILIPVFILISSMSVSASTVVVTDQTNDILELSWNTDLSKAESHENINKPVIDIVSLEYGVTEEENVTITLNLADTPVLDENTFYWVTVAHSDTNLTIILWVGAYLGSDGLNGSYGFVSYLEVISLDDLSQAASVVGNSLIWTLPRQVTSIDYETFEYALVDLNLPATPDSEWEWDAVTWTGTEPYGASLSSGTWWMDDLENSDISNSGSDNTNGSDSSDDNSIPSFEFSAIVSIFILTTLYIKKFSKIY